MKDIIKQKNFKQTCGKKKEIQKEKESAEKERNINQEDPTEREEKIKQKNYTYVIQCSDGTYYTGWTNNLKKRLEMHNAKKGAKYTKGRTPVKLVYYEVFGTKKEAMHREYEIKQMNRKQKEKMIGK